MRIEGVRPVIEAIRSKRRVVHAVILGQALGSPGLRELERLARASGIPLRGGSPSGARAIAEAAPFPQEPFEALLESPSPRLLVALDRVTDVGNLGSIARSAAAAGFSGLILEERWAPPIEPGAMRASAGALEHLRVGRAPSLGRALDLAASEGLRILVADPLGAPIELLGAGSVAGDLLWVFGSEERGVRSSILERAGARVGIPMSPSVGSLGVAAAAAYLLLRTAELRRSGT